MRNSFFVLFLALLLPLSQALCVVPIPLLYIGGSILLAYLTDKGTDWTLETILKKYNLKNLDQEQCLRLGGIGCITDFQDRRILNRPERWDYNEIKIDQEHSIRYEKKHVDAQFLFPIFYDGKFFLVAMNNQEIEESLDEIQYISLSEVEKKKIMDIEEDWNYGRYNE